MIQTLANPIYDCVFKFLMENERIAKLLFSALLKKEVLSTEVRQHKHTKKKRLTISLFSMDFTVRVKDENGKEETMIVKLLKTWIETETSHLRQHLAHQYNDKENQPWYEEPESSTIPTIMVYLLAHRVGNMNEPVLYANHTVKNYDGQEVVEGKNDPFFKSLIHDSIIIQLPLLNGNTSNHLYKILSIFDQSLCYKKDRQIITLDDSHYEDDDDIMYLLYRLAIATTNSEIRYNMNWEDEYMSLIESRDTQIMLRSQRGAEQD